MGTGLSHLNIQLAKLQPGLRLIDLAKMEEQLNVGLDWYQRTEDHNHFQLQLRVLPQYQPLCLYKN